MNPFRDIGVLAVMRMKAGPIPDKHMLLFWIVLLNLCEESLGPLREGCRYRSWMGGRGAGVERWKGAYRRADCSGCEAAG